MKASDARKMTNSLKRLKEAQVSNAASAGTSVGAPDTAALPESRPDGYLPFEEGMEFPPGARVLLPLDRVVENPLNPRVFYSSMESLLASLAADGQMEAALVYPADANGRFMLKSGHRRTRALRRLAKEYIKVEVVSSPKGVVDEYKQARNLNVEHKTHTHFDDAVRFRSLLEDGIFRDQRSLANELNIAEAEVSKIIKLADIPEPIMKELAESPDVFGLSIAYCVYRYWNRTANLEKTSALIHKIRERGLSVRQVENLVRTDPEPSAKGPRARVLRRTELAGPGSGEVKAYGERISLEISKVDCVMREKIFDALVEVLENTGFNTNSADLQS